MRCVVHKYGGSSLADVEMIGRVADRIAATHEEGTRVVAVVSAMGNTTNDLLALARAVSSSPSRRELDMLVSVGERITMTLVAMAGTALVMMPLGLATEPLYSGDSLLVPLVSLVTLGVVCTALGYLMFYKLVRDRGPLFAGMVTYLIPPGALLWGLLVGETITLLQVIALAGILAMVVVVQAGSARPSPTSTS